MRTCEEFAHDVTDYIDGKMTLGPRMSMILHATICSSCRAYRRQIELVRNLAGELKTSQEPTEETVDELAELFTNSQ